MCMVSMVVDDWTDRFNQKNDDYMRILRGFDSEVSKKAEEIELTKRVSELEKEVAELQLAIIDAKKHDAENNEPDCESAEKIEKLIAIADMLGIDISEVVELINERSE